MNLLGASGGHFVRYEMVEQDEQFVSEQAAASDDDEEPAIGCGRFVLSTGSKFLKLVTKKGKGIGKIVFLVALIGVALVACIAWILFYQGEQALPEALSQKISSPVTLDKIMNGAFEPVRFNGTWISDDEILIKNQHGQITIYNVTSRSSRIIVREASLAEIASEIQLSADKKFLLISYNMQKIYRHSSYFSALILDIQTQKQIPIANPGPEPRFLQLIKWAPKGNGYAYVYSNDIYYRPSALSQEELRITHNGNSSHLYNGVCDWVYEEEIFSDTSAMWFSPNGDKLAFASFNDLHVNVMTIAYYGEPGAVASQYPEMLYLRYPKPGRANPTVNMYVVDLKQEKAVDVKMFDISHYFKDPILATVTWITNEEVCLVVMNRVQSQAVVLSCNAHSKQCNQILRLENKKGWIIMFTPPLFSANGQDMLFIHAHDQGGNLGPYRHLTLHNIPQNTTTALTHGRYTVTEILSWDENNDDVYYLATEENKPMRQQVYRISTQENGVHKPECLSCVNENQCSFSSAILSKKHSYFVQTCAGPGIPSINVYNRQNKKVLTWEDNSRLRKSLNNVTLPERQFLTFPVGQGMEAHVLLMIPPNIDKSGQKKYPLLINVYGGPDSNQVFDRYKISWETYYCLNHDVVVALIDGRGSGLKGDNMLFANYRRLGSAEIEDQIGVTKQLQAKFPFIDKKRTAIWGWSYGGYATGMALATDTNKVFKCGASVAPVTDWIYYDSIYTERFMGIPTEKDNKMGYSSSSLVNKATRLAGKKYLLVHGTLDDNVHYQQSMMLARSLELHDILFEQQSYPDEVHSLLGVRHHFYHTLEAFLQECFA